MKKLTAFNLYERKSPAGYHDAPESDPGRGVEVYLAADVKRLLAQIRNSCVDDGDEANALFKLSPGEIRKLIDSELMGSSTHAD